MYEDLRNAVEVLKNYCTDREFCRDCPLHRVTCHAGYINPNAYSLLRFDLNVKELESEES